MARQKHKRNKTYDADRGNVLIKTGVYVNLNTVFQFIRHFIADNILQSDDGFAPMICQGRESLTNFITLLMHLTRLHIWGRTDEGTEKILNDHCVVLKPNFRYNFNLLDSKEPSNKLLLINTSLLPWLCD